MSELGPMEYLLYEYALLSDKNAMQRVKYSGLKERYTDLKKKSSAFRKERDQYKRELDYIHERTWYRVITFFAGLKNKWTGKGKEHS